MDPISWVTCTGEEYWSSVVLRQPNAGCVSAPKDLEAQFDTIRSKVAWWSHFYELDTDYVHSTPIAQADENVLLDYDLDYIDLGAHGVVQADERIWKKITDQIMRDF